MGQTLSAPVTEKETSAGSDDLVAYGSSAMQGWRITMEDAHTTILSLKSGNAAVDALKKSFFAVFDGHGGATVAKYAGEHLHTKLATSDLFREQKYQEAFKAAYLGLDQDMLANPSFEKEMSGCTAVSALITDDWRVIVANAGDSRAVLSAAGHAEPLSFDHKPTNPDESRRIVNAGGFVDFGRVNGNLALSRAIGDFDFKKNVSLPVEEQAVTANPEITERQLLSTDEFIIIACDGIWDVMTSQRAVDFVSGKIAEGLELSEICESIMDACLATSIDQLSVGCDNMTVIIVGLLKGRTKQEWALEVKKRVESVPKPDSNEINDGEGVN